ncbi:FKBP-type peptidyl-prolyl cis-trans isomerase [Flavitalea sp.]|nr:FKBP-type peptidyl-prolyl cis-trans isomerase [Flavitalea sp.]
MKKTASIILCSLAVLLLAACSGGGFKKTKSGVLYKIISDGKGITAQKGQFLKIHVVQNVRKGTKDSLLATSYDAIPVYLPVDSLPPSYNPSEVFMMLRKGDSAQIILEGDSLLRQGGQLPPFMTKSDKIVIGIKVIDVMSEEATNKDRETSEQAYQEVLKKKEVVQLAKDISTIEAYLANKKINAVKTGQGTYVEILSQGDGPMADSGKVVSVKYTGQVLNGDYFDSNIDSTKQFQPHPMDPFEFLSGSQGAVVGMLEGIQKFRKGGKGMLYVPSPLGYGANPRPGGPLKPHDNLVFYIEVLDVKDLPKQPENGRPPGR